MGVTLIKLLKRLQEVQDKPFDEKEQHFIDRTTKHIDMVQAAAKKIEQAHILNGEDCAKLMDQVAFHDASKLKEPERTPYISITWRHKLEKDNDEFDPINSKGYQTPGLLSKDDENQATLHHITTNSHHPEYYSKSQANIDPKDRDKSAHAIDVLSMPDIDIAEMVADWQAMSEELKKNTAREWFNKQKDVRWKFSSHQEELIDKLLKVFETREPYHSLDPHDGVGEDDGW